MTDFESRNMFGQTRDEVLGLNTLGSLSSTPIMTNRGEGAKRATIERTADDTSDQLAGLEVLG